MHFEGLNATATEASSWTDMVAVKQSIEQSHLRPRDLRWSLGLATHFRPEPDLVNRFRRLLCFLIDGGAGGGTQGGSFKNEEWGCLQ